MNHLTKPEGNVQYMMPNIRFYYHVEKIDKINFFFSLFLKCLQAMYELSNHTQHKEKNRIRKEKKKIQ